MSGEPLWRCKTGATEASARVGSFLCVLVDLPVPPGTEVEVWRAGDRECEFCSGAGDCGRCGGDGCGAEAATNPPDYMNDGYCTDGVCTACGGSGGGSSGSENTRSRAGDRPVPPTRQQVRKAIGMAATRSEVTDEAAGRIADAVMALLSGVPTEPEETR